MSWEGRASKAEERETEGGTPGWEKMKAKWIRGRRIQILLLKEGSRLEVCV